jgi:hypothetical protein
MPRTSLPQFSFARRLKEISLFFAGKDEVHKSLRRIVKRLERAGIAYAIVGGMADNAHGYRSNDGRRGPAADPGGTGRVQAAIREEELPSEGRPEPAVH